VPASVSACDLLLLCVGFSRLCAHKSLWFACSFPLISKHAAHTCLAGCRYVYNSKAVACVEPLLAPHPCMALGVLPRRGPAAACWYQRTDTCSSMACADGGAVPPEPISHTQQVVSDGQAPWVALLVPAGHWRAPAIKIMQLAACVWSLELGARAHARAAHLPAPRALPAAFVSDFERGGQCEMSGEGARTARTRGAGEACPRDPTSSSNALSHPSCLSLPLLHVVSAQSPTSLTSLPHTPCWSEAGADSPLSRFPAAGAGPSALLRIVGGEIVRLPAWRPRRALPQPRG
jgi:hypothetical protein